MAKKARKGRKRDTGRPGPEDELEHRCRISPRLQMIYNGDDEVNAIRSAFSGSVYMPPRMAEAAAPIARLRSACEPGGPEDADPDDRLGAAAAGAPSTFGSRLRVSCFVHLENPSRRPAVIPERYWNALQRDDPGKKQRGHLLTLDLSRDRAVELAEVAVDQGIAYVETGSPLSQPVPTEARRHTGAPLREHRFKDAEEMQAFDGPRRRSPVLIGFIDVGGFDFAHPDFLVEPPRPPHRERPAPRTRFYRIWDQGGTGTPPPGFLHGRELTRDEMNQAIEGALEVKVSPSDILPQSVETPGSHGTHVASIAGGERGVCPDALLAGVLIALDQADQDRLSTFFDSTRLAQAVDYLEDLSRRLVPELRAEEDEKKEADPTYRKRSLPSALPLVINISLGTNGHAHDGSSPISRWIDSALARPGRCVCVAAGNSGQEGAQFDGDLGFLSGRIHADGRVAARGLDYDLEWVVVGNGVADVSENEMEIWYEAGDRFAVSLRSPSGEWCCWRIRPCEYHENLVVPHSRDATGSDDPATLVSVYNERYHVANGANRISLFLSPKLKGTISGVQAGTWKVRLHGEEVRDGRFDAWIERDDPRPLGRLKDSAAWAFPSYFSLASNKDGFSVSSLACGRDVIGVANGDPRNECIHASSSQGPTRDRRSKPDIAAPGTRVVAARGFAGTDARQQWVEMTGTSMASPYVAGVAARMLAVQPRLSAAQILGIMRCTAQPLPGADYRWRDDAGFGLLRPGKCVKEVKDIFNPTDAKDRPKETP